MTSDISIPMSTNRVLLAVRKSRTALQAPVSRNASQWASARWSNLVRAQSKATTADDPPTAPLPERHEVEGLADFSNYLDRYDDVSLNQALLSLGTALAVCFGLYKWSVSVAKSTPGKFVRREFPTIESDMPLYKAKSNP